MYLTECDFLKNYDFQAMKVLIFWYDFGDNGGDYYGFWDQNMANVYNIQIRVKCLEILVFEFQASKLWMKKYM